MMNINGKGELLDIHGPLTLPQAEFWLEREYSFVKRLAGQDMAKTVVIVRCDQRATYSRVLELLQVAKGLGFSRYQAAGEVRQDAQGSSIEGHLTFEMEPEPIVDGIQVTVNASPDKDTRRGRITVKGKDLDFQPDTLTELVTGLKDYAGKKDAIELHVDKSLSWLIVMETMDACRQAGFEDVHLMTHPQTTEKLLETKP